MLCYISTIFLLEDCIHKHASLTIVRLCWVRLCSLALRSILLSLYFNNPYLKSLFNSHDWFLMDPIPIYDKFQNSDILNFKSGACRGIVVSGLVRSMKVASLLKQYSRKSGYGLSSWYFTSDECWPFYWFNNIRIVANFQHIACLG